MDIRKRIIKESENLFIKFGIKCISMDDICQKIGISKKTLYQVVSDKEELVREVMVHHLEEEKSVFNSITHDSENAIDEMLKITQHVLTLLKRMNPATSLDLEKHYRELFINMKAAQFDFIYNTMKKNLEKGIKDGIYRDDLNTDIIAKLYMTKAMSMINVELFPDDQYDKTTVFVEHMIYHLRGIISEKGNEFFNKYIQTIQ